MPVVAPVKSTTSLPAMARARRSAFSTRVLPVSRRELSGAAEPMTPTFVRIIFLAIPPTARQKPNKPRHHEEDTNAYRHDAWRNAKPIQQFASNVVRCCHSQRHQGQLGGEDTSPKTILHDSLQPYR